MTQPITIITALLEGASQLITLLERHRGVLPFADEELARHRALRHALDEHHRRGEHALSVWREALSRRWEAEVNGQRVYTATLRQLSEYFGEDPAYAQLVAPRNAQSFSTASDLLADMRRIEASLALLSPRPAFADESVTRLRAAADDLEAAIDWNSRCEAERRSILLEQRIATNLYQRACDKTRRLLASHFDNTPVELSYVTT